MQHSPYLNELIQLFLDGNHLYWVRDIYLKPFQRISNLSKFLMPNNLTGLQSLMLESQIQMKGVLSMCILHRSMDTMLQICNMIKPMQNKITFQMINIQRQPNKRDCGLFAIAVATELANGRDPVLCYWDVTAMRSNLSSFLQAGVLSCFPLAKPRRVPVSSTFKNKTNKTVFCVCWLVNEPSKPMIKCDKCKAWYHYQCVGLTKASSGPWICPEC